MTRASAAAAVIARRRRAYMGELPFAMSGGVKGPRFVLFTRVNVSGAQLRTIRAGNQRINAHLAVITSARLIAAGTPVRHMKFSVRWNGRVGFLFFPTGMQGAGAPFFAFAFPVGDGVAGARVTIGDVFLTKLPEGVVSADKRRDLLHHEYHRAQQRNYSADRTGGWYAFAILYFLKGSDPWETSSSSRPDGRAEDTRNVRGPLPPAVAAAFTLVAVLAACTQREGARSAS